MSRLYAVVIGGATCCASTKILFFLIVLSLIYPHALQAQPSTQLELEFESLIQGHLGKVTVRGEGISQVYAAFLDQQYVFIPDETGNFWGLISAPLAAEPGWYRLSVLVLYGDGSQTYFAEEIRVTLGEFPHLIFNLPPPRQHLSNPDVNLDEIALLNGYIRNLTDASTWQTTGLLAPPLFRIGDGFGTFREFNGEAAQRHTGIDYPTTIGTPVMAAADGRVVLVDRLPIRGNYILIDHGKGLFTGYAHLSQSYVTSGDAVAQGDIIGEVGNTGRSSGPHLHWEVALGGTWVNPLEIVTFLPPPPQ